MPDLNKEKYEHSELTEQVIQKFYKVYNTLCHGFLEKVYESAMFHELTSAGLQVKRQCPITVFYDGVEVGSYYADLIVQGLVIVELKAAESICEEHECQLINYLKATDVEVGLLLNFGKKPQVKRKVYSNSYQRGS
ncbi:MAG: GxxExxY protein [Flavobacteriales bacterium]